MYFFNPIIQLIELIFQLLFWLVIIIAGIAIFKAATKTGVVADDEIIQSWSSLIANQASAGDEFLTLTESELDVRSNPFDISRKSYGFTSPSKFIKIKMNFAYSCYIGYESVGKDLSVSWSLREKLGFLYKIPFIGPFLYRFFHVITIVDRNKLIAFASFTMDCTQNAVESLMDKYNLDKSKLTKVSSGKLGPL